MLKATLVEYASHSAIGFVAICTQTPSSKDPRPVADFAADTLVTCVELQRTGSSTTTDVGSSGCGTLISAELAVHAIPVYR